MIEPDDIRGYATALPEVEEGTHFGLCAFKVRGKGFVTVQKGDTHAILSTDHDTTAAAAAEDPAAYEEVWRNGGAIFVGLRADLAAASADRFGELVEAAWRNKAPKRLVAAYDQDAATG